MGPRRRSSSSTSGRSAACRSARRPPLPRPRWSTCSVAVRADRHGCSGWPRRRPTRRSPARLRQADRLRASQDGAPHRDRRKRRGIARAGADGPRGSQLGRGSGRRRTRGGEMSDPGSAGRSPIVGIVGGSRSDFPILQSAVAILDELGVSSELRVVSAHRTPDHLFRYAEDAAGRGIRVIVAGAGGAAHLPGMLAAKTALPVIGVPIPTEHLGGLDSLLSIVQMPRGIPVATVAIGNATNAGLLAAAILALSDAPLAERLAAWRARQTQTVLDDPSNDACPADAAVLRRGRGASSWPRCFVVAAVRRRGRATPRGGGSGAHRRLDWGHDGRRAIGAGHARPGPAGRSGAAGSPPPDRSASPPSRAGLPHDRSALPPSLAALPPAASPRPRPRRCSRTTSTCASSSRMRGVAITALELGAALGSPLVKACVAWRRRC